MSDIRYRIKFYSDIRYNVELTNQNWWIFLIRGVSPVSGVKIAALIVLALRKEHKKIGSVQKRFRHTLPIGPEIAI
jgi:hypothetical protein